MAIQARKVPRNCVRTKRKINTLEKCSKIGTVGRFRVNAKAIVSAICICRMLEKDPKVTGTLVEHGWNITERVTRGHYKLHVKQSAVHFYLHVCGFVAAYEVDSCVSMLPYLVELVEGFIQRSFQHFGKTLQQSAKFGCGTKTHLELEFNVRNH